MKNGRPKMGESVIDWKEVAFGAGKNRRKTVGFGKYDKREREYEDEFYIRELSIVDGGIGCALWDAAIILTRWIYGCQKQAIAAAGSDGLFSNAVVLELGAGVGLPGICAARYAKSCFLTDYLTPVVDNLRYNIQINSSIVDWESGEEMGEEGSEDDDSKKRQVLQEKINMHKSARAILLNWDHIHSDQLMIEDDPNVQLIPRNNVDIILGSELTYTGNESTINNLVRVIDAFLKPNGVFVEVLSDDRDGVSHFLEDVKKNGYAYSVIPVAQRYLGNFNTKQRPETYRFYVFVRENEMEGNQMYDTICKSMQE